MLWMKCFIVIFLTVERTVLEMFGMSVQGSKCTSLLDTQVGFGKQFSLTVFE